LIESLNPQLQTRDPKLLHSVTPNSKLLIDNSVLLPELELIILAIPLSHLAKDVLTYMYVSVTAVLWLDQ